ncbi:asparagine synthase [Ectobacillus funiculus]|uniref:Asparagine synthase n=1 Tax=Ectobacillus funiculus TaxID=137993 RepID=A0ABV5WC18_9BACI
MNIREGLIPTVLGTAVSATGYALKQNRNISPMVANTVFGFGLAHIALGVSKKPLIW